jgi:hypothetical protein
MAQPVKRGKGGTKKHGRMKRKRERRNSPLSLFVRDKISAAAMHTGELTMKLVFLEELLNLIHLFVVPQ